jgi:nicotinamidase-related amidase
LGRPPPLGVLIRGTLMNTLRPERAVLVLVDLQERLLPAIVGRERIVKNSLLLLRVAGILGLPVILTTQYRKGLGEIVPEVREATPGLEPLDKVSFGCFQSEGFLSRLSALPGRDQLLVAGVESHICVAQTALAALREGYIVHVASDAVSSRTEWNWKIGLERMRAAGTVISSTEMMIYELMRSSSSPAFKEMLPHLKG